MKYKTIAPLALTAALVIAMLPQLAQADLVGASGKVTMIRIHELGTKYGPHSDQIDVEVVFKLSGHPDKAFGFQLRDDINLYVRQGMLALLRDAMAHDWTVQVQYFTPQEFPKKNVTVYRLIVTK